MPGKLGKDGIVHPGGYEKDPTYKYLGHFAQDKILQAGHNNLFDFLPGGAARKEARLKVLEEKIEREKREKSAPLPEATPLNPGVNPSLRGRRELEEKLLKEKY